MRISDWSSDVCSSDLLEQKEDLESGSRAAVLGGITGVFEMPNTKPNTDTADALADKLKRAAGRMWCAHAFYVGATKANARHLGELEMLPGAAGIKGFMGASTRGLLLSDGALLAEGLEIGRAAGRGRGCKYGE